MGQLTAELLIDNMKSLFRAFQPGTGVGEPGAPMAAALKPEEDVLSVAVSAAEFAEYGPDGVPQEVASGALWRAPVL